MNLDADLIAQASAERGMGEEYGNTSGLHHHAFDNPAIWKRQPIVWIADDKLGLGRSEVDRLKTQEVDASCEYATMDEKGKVDVQRGPPDEAWYDGKTAA
jgi:calcium permeable stress-gated cation channel